MSFPDKIFDKTKVNYVQKCAYVLNLIKNKNDSIWLKYKVQFETLKPEESYEFYNTLVHEYQLLLSETPTSEAVKKIDKKIPAIIVKKTDEIKEVSAKKIPVKKAAVKKVVAAKKAPAKKAAAKKAPVKKAAAKKAVAKKAPVKKAVAKKAPVKKAVAKKAPVKKAAAKKAPVKKAAVKKAPLKKKAKKK